MVLSFSPRHRAQTQPDLASLMANGHQLNQWLTLCPVGAVLPPNGNSADMQACASSACHSMIFSFSEAKKCEAASC
jgi:hypothetical protein